MHDLLAKIVSLDDDKTLYKMFPKDVGPNAKLILHANSGVLMALADDQAKKYWHSQSSIVEEAMLKDKELTVAESLETHDKERRKRVAQLAVAKRGAKRTARTLGTVVL